MFWLIEVPKFRKWLAKVGLHVVLHSFWEARTKMEELALDMVDRTEQHRLKVDVDNPVVYSHLRSTIPNEEQVRGENLRLEIASECLDYLRMSISAIENEAVLN